MHFCVEEPGSLKREPLFLKCVIFPLSSRGCLVRLGVGDLEAKTWEECRCKQRAQAERCEQHVFGVKSLTAVDSAACPALLCMYVPYLEEDRTSSWPIRPC